MPLFKALATHAPSCPLLTGSRCLGCSIPVEKLEPYTTGYVATHSIILTPHGVAAIRKNARVFSEPASDRSIPIACDGDRDMRIFVNQDIATGPKWWTECSGMTAAKGNADNRYKVTLGADRKLWRGKITDAFRVFRSEDRDMIMVGPTFWAREMPTERGGKHNSCGPFLNAMKKTGHQRNEFFDFEGTDGD